MYHVYWEHYNFGIGAKVYEFLSKVLSPTEGYCKGHEM